MKYAKKFKAKLGPLEIDDSVIDKHSSNSKQFPGVENLSAFEYQLIKGVYENRVMGTPLGLANLIESVKYLIKNNIEGDFVECGVWRGGSSILIAEAAIHFDESRHRNIWLYDTFSGMTAPTDDDVRIEDNKSAMQMKWNIDNSSDLETNGYLGGVPAAATLEDVKKGFAHLSSADIGINYIVGPVEETLIDPKNLPEKIALLKLDTDWYESSKIELDKLWHRVVSGGVVVLDDYDYWNGTRKAYDEFEKSLEYKPLLVRLDHGRILIKP